MRRVASRSSTMSTFDSAYVPNTFYSASGAESMAQSPSDSACESATLRTALSAAVSRADGRIRHATEQCRRILRCDRSVADANRRR
jgi:hypothetical protein